MARHVTIAGSCLAPRSRAAAPRLRNDTATGTETP